ncbi:MAG: hypothetical protein ACFFCW_32115 [Candidatus Hodarchaeota archaeon]
MRTLPKRTKHFFDQFIDSANKQIPHPVDMKRFYRFIHAAHQGRTRLSASELEQLLVCAGFMEDLAADLANIYYHGRGLLASKPNLSYVHRKTGT